MANIVRAPFFVPRAGDEAVWFPTPTKSPIISFLTKQKITGAGGQVPTKAWAPVLTNDDNAVWNWASPRSGGIWLTYTQVKMYGQNGQAPTKNWQPQYTNDDNAVWIWPPQTSHAIIETYTQAKFFGQNGQAPTKRWNSQYTYDDAAFWEGSPEPSEIISLLTQQKFYASGGQAPTKQWHYDFDDASVWQFKAPRNGAALAVQAPFVPVFWKYWNDEGALSFWDASPTKSPIIAYLTQTHFYGAGGQVPTKQWHYDTDDAALWEGSPEPSAIVPLLTQQKIYGKGGQVPTPIWLDNFVWDDAALWTWQPPKNGALSKQPSPFAPVFWRYNNDDPSSFWQFSANYNASAFASLPIYLFQNEFFVPTYDDAPSWQQTIIKNVVIGSVASPFVPPVWRYNNDDPSPFWQFSSNYNAPAFASLPVYLFQNEFFVPTYDDAPSWQQTIIKNAIINSVASPFVPPVWRYNYDDSAVWSGAPVPYPATIALSFKMYGAPGQAPTKDYSAGYTFDDATVWYASPMLSKSIVLTTTQQKLFGQPGQAPTKQWHYDFDDASVWWEWTNRNLSIIVGVPSPFAPVRPRFDYDDAAAWSNQINRNLVGLVSPPVGRQVRIDWDDHAVWQWQPHKSLAPTAYAIRANYAYVTGPDDAAVWYGLFKSVSPVLTSGTPFVSTATWRFNLASEHFWQASFPSLVKFIPVASSFPFVRGKWSLDVPADTPSVMPPQRSALLYIPLLLTKRIATALAEVRTAIAPKVNTPSAPAETRTGKAPQETRTANTPSEVRTTSAPKEDT